MSCQEHKPVYIECDCHSEVTQLILDDDVDMIFISYYGYGSRRGFSWKQRLRMIWQIIKWGYPYGDNLILRKPDVKNFINELQKMYDKMLNVEDVKK